MIMGSVTGFKCTRMSPIETFNGQLAVKELVKEHGGNKLQAQKHQKVLMLLGNGIRRKMVKPAGHNKKPAWRSTFEDNLPFPIKDMLVVNIPPIDDDTPSSTPLPS